MRIYRAQYDKDRNYKKLYQRIKHVDSGIFFLIGEAHFYPSKNIGKVILYIFKAPSKIRIRFPPIAVYFDISVPFFFFKIELNRILKMIRNL